MIDAGAGVYIVDTCSFTELRRAYPRPAFDVVWKLVEERAATGHLLSVEDVLIELNAHDDEVAAWANTRSEIFLPLDVEQQVEARRILTKHPTLVDMKRRKSGADPFVVAAAKLRGATVVTQEKPSGGPPAVKIPDACRAEGIPCISLVELLVREELAT